MIVAAIIALALVGLSGLAGFLYGNRGRGAAWPAGVAGACLVWAGLFLDWYADTVFVIGIGGEFRIGAARVPNWLLLAGAAFVIAVNVLPRLRRSRFLFALALVAAAYGIAHCVLSAYCILRVEDAPVGWGPFVTAAGFMVLLALSCATLSRQS